MILATDFRALITADLDTSQVQPKLDKLNPTLTISRFSLNTKNLPSEIQASLSGHKFTINLTGINTKGIETQMSDSGSKAGEVFSKTLVSKINTQLNNGGIEASISKVFEQYTKLSNSGHTSLGLIQDDIQKLISLQTAMVESADNAPKELVKNYNEFNRVLTETKNYLTIVSSETKTFVSESEIGQLSAKMSTWLANNSHASDEYRISVRGLMTQLEELASQDNVTIADLSRVASSFDEVSAAAKSESATIANTAKTINAQLSNGSIDTAIKKVTAEFVTLGNTGHTSLGSIEKDIGQLNALQNQMSNAGSPKELVTAYERYNEVLKRVKNALSLVSTETKTYGSINEKIASGKIDAAISKVTAEYTKLSNTGHSSLQTIEKDIIELSNLQTQMLNSTSSEQMVLSYNQFNETLSRVKNSLAIVSAESRTFVSATQIDQLDAKMQVWLTNNSKAAKQYGSTIQQLRNQLAQMRSQGNATTADLQRVSTSFNQVSMAAKVAGLNGKTFTDSLKGAFTSISRYVSAATLIYRAIATLRAGANTVVELDTALVDLQKTSTATASQLTKFYSEANEQAKQLGVTTKEIIQAAADWSRLGFSLKDSQTMAEVSSIMKSISPGMDMSTATDALVSSMKANNKCLYVQKCA